MCLFLSYCEQNLMSDSRYRKYSENVPKYLNDRPKHLVTHCLQRLSSVRDFYLSGIAIRDDGIFTITSFLNTREFYTVKFGDEESMPHCECLSWRQTSYPCKHFFAIFKKFPRWGWDSLSSLYTQSPFLTLNGFITEAADKNDLRIIAESSPDHPDSIEENLSDEFAPNINGNLEIEMNNTGNLKQMQSDIREDLEEIKSSLT